MGKIAVLVLIILSLTLVGCNSQEVSKIEEKPLIVETEDVEIETKETSDEEILVYNETMILKYVTPAQNKNLNSYYYGFEDVEDRIYLEFDKLGINEEYPFVRIKISADNYYTANIMQEKFRTIQLK